MDEGEAAGLILHGLRAAEVDIDFAAAEDIGGGGAAIVLLLAARFDDVVIVEERGRTGDDLGSINDVSAVRPAARNHQRAAGQNGVRAGRVAIRRRVIGARTQRAAVHRRKHAARGHGFKGHVAAGTDDEHPAGLHRAAGLAPIDGLRPAGLDHIVRARSARRNNEQAPVRHDRRGRRAARRKAQGRAGAHLRGNHGGHVLRRAVGANVDEKIVGHRSDGQGLARVERKPGLDEIGAGLQLDVEEGSPDVVNQRAAIRDCVGLRNACCRRKRLARGNDHVRHRQTTPIDMRAGIRRVRSGVSLIGCGEKLRALRGAVARSDKRGAQAGRKAPLARRGDRTDPGLMKFEARKQGAAPCLAVRDGERCRSMRCFQILRLACSMIHILFQAKLHVASKKQNRFRAAFTFPIS